MEIEGKQILFLDTFNYFKTSIEKLGQYFGIEKIQIDFEKEVDTELLIERCKRDVAVTYLILKSLYAQMPNFVKFSAAQLSFSILRTMLQYPIQKINTDIADLSYHGGRVEVFRKDEAYTKKYDVTSMYPFVMRNNPFPIGIKENVLNPTKAYIDKMVKDGFTYIADCNFNIPDMHIPPIPFIKKNPKKLIFPIGKFNSVVCEPELTDNFDYVTRFNQVEFYYKGEIFKEFIDKYFPLKETSTGFMREFYKVGVLNSSYGKFGQKYVKTERFNQYDNLVKFGRATLTDIENIHHDMKFLNGECFSNVKGKRKFSVAVGSFITSLARKNLYDRCHKYGEDLYYVDTDCFVLPDNIKVDIPSGLGGLKIEDAGLSRFYAPKLYYYVKNDSRMLKLKGIKKTWSLNWTNDKIYATGKRFSNFSETLGKNRFTVLEIEQNKTVRLMDDKRIWENNFSHPIKL